MPILSLLSAYQLSCVPMTQGRELLHVYRHAGEEIIVWLKEKPRTTVTTRRGMGLYYCYLTFSKWKDVYYHE